MNKGSCKQETSLTQLVIKLLPYVKDKKTIRPASYSQYLKDKK
mgnify:CR=1 FL=1